MGSAPLRTAMAGRRVVSLPTSQPSLRPLIVSRMTYFEGLADIQMLAMLSCVLSQPQHKESHPPDDRAWHRLESAPHSTEIYTPSVEHIVGLPEAAMDTPLLSLRHGRGFKRKTASIALDVPSTREPPPRIATITPSVSFRHSRASSDLYDSRRMPLSTSPEQLRRVPRSNSNLASAFAASLSQTFLFNASAPPSPPPQPRKRPSPAGSAIGATPTVAGIGGTNYFGMSAIISGDPRTTLLLPVSDTEEGESSPQKPVFHTKYKNQDKFELDGYTDVSSLAIPDESRYDTYRSAYAEMLFAWELPIQMCEVLEYNESIDVNTPSKHDPNMAFRKNSPDSSHAFNGIDFKDNCPACKNPITTNRPTNSCPDCSVRSSPLICILCSAIIRGLASPCLSCGHALHPACRTFLRSRSPSFDDSSCDEDQTYHCISGCGCLCDSYTFIEMSAPEQIIRNDSEDAKTIIANEQDEPRHDVAYLSLATNLGQRRLLTPKSSQIWRGGEAESNRERKKSVGSSLRYEERFGL